MSPSRILQLAAALLVVASSPVSAIAQTVCVSASGPGQIIQATPSGSSVFASGLSSGGLVFDTAGNLYAGDLSSGKVWKFEAGIGSRTQFAAGFNITGGMVFDAGGNLYVASSGANQISKVGPGGSPVSDFASGGDLIYPWGLAFDPSGNLYVSNHYGDTISRITPSGGVSWFANVSRPTGLAFDASGNLYAASWSTGGGIIFKFTGAEPGAVSQFASGINQVQGIAFDAAGNLYAASFGTDTIYQFAPTYQAGDPLIPFASGSGSWGPIYITVGAIPEPASMAELAGLAVLVLAAGRRAWRHGLSGLRQSDGLTSRLSTTPT